MVLAIVGLFRAVPNALAPTEDQGYVFVIGVLQDAASLRSHGQGVRCGRRAKCASTRRSDNAVAVAGVDPLTFASKTNAGVIWLPLKPWDERTGDDTLSPEAVVNAVFGVGSEGQGCDVLRRRAAADRRLVHVGRLRGLHSVARARHGRRSSQSVVQKFVAAASQRQSWRAS